MATNEMATERLGNTKARRCQLTLNEVPKYPQLFEYLTSINTLKYLISCKENAPTTGHEHIHWLGIENAECAIYDNFRPSDMKPSEFINFIDYNKHAMNVKGGSRQNMYTRIFITSVVDPEYLYMGIASDEPRKQWMRRMEVVKLENKMKEE